MPEKLLPIFSPKTWLAVACVVGACCQVVDCDAQESGPPAPPRSAPLSPSESFELLECVADWQARLIAAEPLVIDPVEVAFDDAGRMWVVEMRDYPYRVADEPRGCVKVITDADGDGVYDHATIFADKLEMPTGIALWKNGAVITLAGEVAYFVDHDHDLVADEKQQWLKGLATENEQLRANHPRLGPDGWWYIACGLRGGEVQLGSHFEKETSNSNEPLRIGSRDIRFDPESERIEAVTGPAQFGLTFDLLGSRFFCSNRNPAVQVVFEQAELANNPLVGLVPSTSDVLPAGAESRVYPLVDAWTTSNLHAGQFTAACGLFMLNRDGRFEECYVCEPTGSLVKRERLRRSTATLVRVDEPQDGRNESGELQREWLASRDAWFRPVNITVAPNADIVVVDMHRAVIEHPKWVPEELKNRPDERWGNAVGRVFTLSMGRPDSEAPSKRSNWIQRLQEKPLGSLSTAELVELLSRNNPWRRETATRLLLERKDLAAIPSLQAQALNRDLNVACRVYALRILTLLSGSIPGEVTASLSSEGSDLFVAASLRISRQITATELSQEDTLNVARRSRPTDEQLVAFLDRPGPVQFEALLCLAGSAAKIEQEAFNQIVAQGDPLLLVSLGTAFGKEPELLFDRWLVSLNASEHGSSLQHEIVREVSAKLASALLNEVSTQEVEKRLEQTMSLFETQCTTNCRIACLSALSIWLEKVSFAHPEEPESREFWSSVQSLAADVSAALSLRQPAVKLLGRSPLDGSSAFLKNLANDPRHIDLLPDIIAAWAKTNDPACQGKLEELLVSGTPASRRTAVNLIAGSQNRLAALADKLEQGQLESKLLSASELKLFSERARGQAQQVFKESAERLTSSDRKQVLAAYESALDLDGDTARGKALFAKNCAACHRVGDIGVDIGPDISDSRSKQPVQLLTSILDPNLAIDNNYFRYVIVTADGRIAEGMIAEETNEAIILLGQDNRRTVIYRDDIESFKATGVSLMPEGLEAQIDHQAMADLIAFIKGWRYETGSIPGL